MKVNRDMQVLKEKQEKKKLIEESKPISKEKVVVQ
jgi:hypothetical protein